jgi:transcriptional regulator with PAS, ATPase and Fis domain
MAANEFQSLIDTHDDPFVVINEHFEIVAVNRAFEQAYRTDRQELTGRHCYEVTHGLTSPCFEHGEDCPHRRVFEAIESHGVVHTHFDASARVHLVRISAYPIHASNGELLLGERYHELSVRDRQCDYTRQMVGRSPAFTNLVKDLELAARTDSPVLIHGETGTGKELAAAFIHAHSDRREKPFITLDCTVLTEALFESEVFGHERGAFTGSVGEKKGLFELAHSGSLFLDEVGELPLFIQSKLLRVLETGQFRRVGGRESRQADARIVCATNRDLRGSNDFRRDLFYRIACLTIEVPPLRARREDIPVLAQNLLQCIGHADRRKYTLTADAVRRLQSYHFPGNIRELRNILAVGALRSTTGTVDGEMLGEVIGSAQRPIDAGGPSRSGEAPTAVAQSGSTLAEREAAQIDRALREFGGNRRVTAAVLGISERTLYRRIKRYGLDVQQ